MTVVISLTLLSILLLELLLLNDDWSRLTGLRGYGQFSVRMSEQDTVGHEPSLNHQEAIPVGSSDLTLASETGLDSLAQEAESQDVQSSKEQSEYYNTYSYSTGVGNDSYYYDINSTYYNNGDDKFLHYWYSGSSNETMSYYGSYMNESNYYQHNTSEQYYYGNEYNNESYHYYATNNSYYYSQPRPCALGDLDERIKCWDNFGKFDESLLKRNNFESAEEFMKTADLTGTPMDMKSDFHLTDLEYSQLRDHSRRDENYDEDDEAEKDEDDDQDVDGDDQDIEGDDQDIEGDDQNYHSLYNESITGDEFGQEGIDLAIFDDDDEEEEEEELYDIRERELDEENANIPNIVTALEDGEPMEIVSSHYSHSQTHNDYKRASKLSPSEVINLGLTDGSSTLSEKYQEKPFFSILEELSDDFRSNDSYYANLIQSETNITSY